MGLARELSMGPPRKRSRVGNTGDYATLRRLTKAANPDLVKFREVLDRVSGNPHRFRPAEGAAYIAACARYTELTGQPYGIQQGTY